MFTGEQRRTRTYNSFPWHGRGRRFDPDQVHHPFNHLPTSLFPLGVIWCQTILTASNLSSSHRLLNHILLPAGVGFVIAFSTLIDGFHGRLHALWNLLHVDVGGGCGARVPEQALHVLHRAFLLRQGGDRSPDDLYPRPLNVVTVGWFNIMTQSLKSAAVSKTDQRTFIVLRHNRLHTAF